MSRKHLGFLRASVKEGAVHLRAYKATPAFNARESVNLFEAIRVFRKEETGFEFGNDYAEYFDGLSHHDADLIFEGPLTPGNKRKFTYVDRDAKMGSTYAYWMAPAQGEPSGPAAVKIRDHEVWWPYEKVVAAIAALQAKHPEMVQVETVGHTVRRRPIQAVRVGSGKRVVALVGAVHSGESGPELILPALEALLAQHAPLLSKIAVLAVPEVNADEREREVEGVPWYLRTNANGVDINRNFPVDWDTTEYGYGLESSDPDASTYRGAAPASEPETQALMDCLSRHRPVAVFACHCLASICGACFLAPRCGKDDAPYAARCSELGTAYAVGMAPELLEHQAVRFGTTSGSLAAWCYRELAAPAFDIEISGAEKEALAKCRVDKTDRALLADYQHRHLNGLLALLAKIAAEDNKG